MIAILFLVLLVGALFLWNKLVDLDLRLRDLEQTWDLAVSSGVAPEVTRKEEPEAPTISVPSSAASPRWTRFDEPLELEMPLDMEARIQVDRPAAEQTSVPATVGPQAGARPVPCDSPEIGFAEPAEPDSAQAPVATSDFSFEDLFGRKLPIWIGGITLAIAGSLIVKYSIERGLLSPLVRVILGLLFGSGLIGAAEIALRTDKWVRDERIRQALAGAGIATLYASFLVATNVYHLLDPVSGFLGLASVTALAMFLALRFGPPSALLGLLGGLAAPALVGTATPNIPLLSTYLALTIGGLCTFARRQGWAWLGLLAIGGGFGWSLLLLVTSSLADTDAIALGLYLLLIGVLLPALSLSGKVQTAFRFLATAVAAAQMAALVAAHGFTGLDWALFGLMAAALLWLRMRDERLRFLPAFGITMTLLLLVMWRNPAQVDYTIPALIIGALFAGAAAMRLWRPRGSLLDAAEIAVLVLGNFVAAAFHYYRMDASQNHAFSGLALCLAVVPAAAATLGYRKPERHDDARFAILLRAAAVLFVIAQILILPAWAIPPALSMTALALIRFAAASEEPRLTMSGWLLLSITILWLIFGPPAIEIHHALGETPPATDSLRSLVRWGVPALVMAMLAPAPARDHAKASLQGLSVLLGYVALAQVVPTAQLSLLPAAGLTALSLAAGRTSRDLMAAVAVAFALLLLWAVYPLLLWLQPSLMALAGEPLLFSHLPALADTALRLLVPSAAIGASLFLLRPRDSSLPPLIGGTAAGLLALPGLHILYKQLFHIASLEGFVQRGIGERSCWELFLFAAAFLAWKASERRPLFRWAALAAFSCGVAHLIWFSLLLHNPLWSQQAVGSLPLLNGVTAIALVAVAADRLFSSNEPELARDGAVGIATGEMLIALFFAYGQLRQVFHGSLLAVPGLLPAEDVLRSILAVAIAIAFLIRGITAGSKTWRIGSLILMLGTVGKVFLSDAAGLDGLPRILSFIALGFSLLGIGWLYSRYLPDNRIKGVATGAG